MEILITGGSGSFGQAYIRRLLSQRDMVGLPTASRIVVYSRGEHAQETMANELGDDSRLRFFIGDVRDRDRLEFAMRGIDVVVHAAALKIVPTAEYNPTECVATNIIGAENVVTAALRAGVKRVLALSTDKAVNPVNLYGASKLAAEKIFVAANALAAGKCAFSVVRYGNVVGSRGSVVPLFKRLKAEAKPITITDPRMTRFWITMDQAIDLVQMALKTMGWREIFVPKIPSMRVLDLADAVDPGGTRHIVGIRPGEKVHECLVTEDDNAFDCGDHFAILPHGQISHKPKVAEGFRYTSDANEHWLTTEELRALL